MSLKIAIGAGHGLNTLGKRCLKSLDPNETREWYLNDRIADKLEESLKAYGCEVLRVGDTTGKTNVALSTRVKKANDWGADVYISIHHNAGINGGTGGGTVVYYYNKYTTKEQAQALYDAIIARTGLKGNRSTPVAKGNFQVIRETKMTAFLIENGFMDSKTDVPIILTDSHATKTAQGILDWLVKAYGLKVTKTVAETVAESDILYKVQCGAFKNKANADALLTKLKNAGFNGFITTK